MKIVQILSETFLFRGINEKTLERIISENPPSLSTYKRGDLIYSSMDERKLVGFVASGRCEIRIDSNERTKTLLNTLSTGESFGVLSIYSDDDFPTKIYATVNCSVIFFSDSQIRHFVNNYSQITQNLIIFLAGRISFLNKKISTFTGVRVEDRLWSFLLSEREKHSSDIIPFNYQKTSEEINAGRASVYRAVSSLEESGLIKLIDKQIQIIDPKGFERKKI